MIKPIHFTLLLLKFFFLPLRLYAQHDSFKLIIKAGLSSTPPYLVKYYNSTHWEKFNAKIQLFDYNSQYEYELRIQKKKVGRESIYLLKNVIRKSRPASVGSYIWDVAENYVNDPISGRSKNLQIKSSVKDKWEYISTPIHGFNYQEGNRYRIKVRRVEKNTDTPEYELLEVINKQHVTDLPNVSPFLARFKWNVLQLKGKDVSKTKANIGFDAKNGTIAGSTGCNNYWGNFNIKGNSIHFTHLASTMRFCRDDQVEKDFFEIIEHNKIEFDIAEQTLNLYIAGRLVLIFGLELE